VSCSFVYISIIFALDKQCFDTDFLQAIQNNNNNTSILLQWLLSIYAWSFHLNLIVQFSKWKILPYLIFTLQSVTQTYVRV